MCEGFSEYEKGLLKKAGYTPEEARDKVVERLKEFNLNEKDLSYFDCPIDKLPSYEVEVVLSMTLYYKNYPKEWCDHSGEDLSDHSNYVNMCIVMDS